MDYSRILIHEHLFWGACSRIYNPRKIHPCKSMFCIPALFSQKPFHWHQVEKKKSWIICFHFQLLSTIQLHFQQDTKDLKSQKHSSRGVPRKRCSENMQKFHRKTPMLKCDSDKVASHIFRTPLYKRAVTYGGLLL